MQEKLIDFILWLNKKFFFKRSHPFNESKNGLMNLNYSEFEYNHTEELIKMYEKELNLDFQELFKNKNLLEVGCGGGGKSVYLAEKYNFEEIIGIDINDIFISQAIDFARQHKVDNFVHFYKKSALETDFEVDKFDIILLTDILEHIPKTRELLQEMYRILKPGGIILFDFAPYYHYFGHHLTDTIQIPWIHLFFSDKFLIKLYKKSVEGLKDTKQRIDLRIGKTKVSVPSRCTGTLEERFDYLNKISRKKFEKIMGRLCEDYNLENNYKIKYLMLKNVNFFNKIPLLREIFIKHIIGYIKK